MLPANSSPGLRQRATSGRRQLRPERRRSLAATLLLGALALAAGLWLGGCTTSNTLLTFFFDGVPAAGQAQPLQTPSRPPRRLPYRPPAPRVIVVEAPELPPAVDWLARFAQLARSKDGQVLWVKAIDDKFITPRPGIAKDAEDQEPEDLDLEFIPKSDPTYKVVFRHEPHTKWLVCDNCHDDIFAYEHGSARMTMKKIDAGEYCGVCHGKVALPDLDDCEACHKDM